MIVNMNLKPVNNNNNQIPSRSAAFIFRFLLPPLKRDLRLLLPVLADLCRSFLLFDLLFFRTLFLFDDVTLCCCGVFASIGVSCSFGAFSDAGAVFFLEDPPLLLLVLLEDLPRFFLRFLRVEVFFVLVAVLVFDSDVSVVSPL